MTSMPVILTFAAGLLALSTWVYLKGFGRAARSLLIVGLLYLLLADLLGSGLNLVVSFALGAENDWPILAFVLVAPLVAEGVKVHAAKSRTGSFREVRCTTAVGNLRIDV